jgi:enterochelin esterase family protein
MLIFEYAFLVQGRRRPDPLNPYHYQDGFGNVNSSVRMPKWVETPLATRKRGIPSGTVKRYQVEGQRYIVGKARTVHLYRPATDDPVPLLVVFDGSGYLRQAKLTTIVDNLIAEKRIRPLALAMVDPGRDGRTVEYACSDTTTAFIIRCVLPLARRELNLLDVEREPGAYGIMGASMGGLMSMYIAHRAPEIFGSVLSQSGAFDSDHLYYRSVLTDLVRYAPRPKLNIWMDAGLQEWFIAPNRAMRALLLERGYTLQYVEHNSGHNYTSWRNIVWRGLEHLYRNGAS